MFANIHPKVWLIIEFSIYYLSWINVVSQLTQIVEASACLYMKRKFIKYSLKNPIQSYYDYYDYYDYSVCAYRKSSS